MFDGCLLFEDAKALKWLMTQMYLKKHRKAVRDPALSVRKMTELYGPIFGPGMGKSFTTMSKASLLAIVAACTKCEFHPYPKELERKLYFEYGSNGPREQGDRIIARIKNRQRD